MEVVSLSPAVAIVMGSKSDMPVMESAVEILQRFGVPYEVRVMSAHRTPVEVSNFASNAVQRGIKVIIAGAGGAAHLPGVIAAHTTLPVIGVPIASSPLHGIDALHSIVQMPRGIPVATVGVDNAVNAAQLAIAILALNDAELSTKLERYRAEMRERVLSADAEVRP